MQNNFCVFILTHGRADNVMTYNTIKKHGYTGKIYIVVDDEDSDYPKYIKKYGKKVIQFSKKEVAKTIDEGDNFEDRRAIIYARNACFNIARQVGCKYFIQLDDDYQFIQINFNSRLEHDYGPVESLDDVFDLMVNYYESIPALSICLAQGGDLIGGGQSSNLKVIKAKRKAMNSFVCSVDRPFKFFGRINEDVNTYTTLGRQGFLFMTISTVAIIQRNTQTNPGGMTDIYVGGGTYIKSFYSVMYSPSCVKIGEMGEVRRRIHHRINWNNCVPVILREEHRKAC